MTLEDFMSKLSNRLDKSKIVQKNPEGRYILNGLMFILRDVAEESETDFSLNITMLDGVTTTVIPSVVQNCFVSTSVRKITCQIVGYEEDWGIDDCGKEYRAKLVLLNEVE